MKELMFEIKNKILKYNGWKLYFIPSVFFFFVWGLTNIVLITDFKWSDLDKYEDTVKIAILEKELDNLKNIKIPNKEEIESRNTSCLNLKELNMTKIKKDMNDLFNAVNKNTELLKIKETQQLPYSDKSVMKIEVNTENKFKEIVLVLLLKKAYYLYDYENKQATIYFKTNCQ